MKRGCFLRIARAQNAHVEAKLNHSFPAQVKACRCVVGSDSLRRCLETFLGVTNAMRVTESRGIELGSLLALARAKADDAAAVNAGGTDFEGALKTLRQLSKALGRVLTVVAEA